MSTDYFSFLIHPLNHADIIRHEPKAEGKSERLLEKIVEWLPSHKASHIEGIESKEGNKAEGWFVTVPLLPKQFLSLDRKMVMDKVIKGAKIGQELGAKIVGLGGFTSVIGDAGFSIAKNVDIAVTSGNSYTIATAIEATLKYADIMEIDISKAKAAVIGATGSIGSVCSKILAPMVSSITLVARNQNRLGELGLEIGNIKNSNVNISTKIDEVLPQCDIIISASTSGGLITSDLLKIGSLICDVALPHDVCREVAKQRNDVLIIEGGLVQVPGNPRFNYDFGYPPGISLACMAETMILTLERKFENFSLGRSIEIEKIDEIKHYASKHGFKLAGIRSFDKEITLEEVVEIKNNARIKKKSQKILI